MPVTPQMILANMNERNQRMQRLELIINDKLSKLDLLDVLRVNLAMMLRSFPSLLSPSLWTFWNLNSDTSASGINNSSTKNFFTTFSVFSIAPSDYDKWTK
jgi:hypothetical protein